MPLNPLPVNRRLRTVPTLTPWILAVDFPQGGVVVNRHTTGMPHSFALQKISSPFSLQRWSWHSTNEDCRYRQFSWLYFIISPAFPQVYLPLVAYVRADSVLQWRNRAGVQPDFPIEPSKRAPVPA
jgi:hypothetical protein